MKYTCPTCGKTYDANYCDECKKAIQPISDNSGKNAMQVWGIIITIFGVIGVLAGFYFMIIGDATGMYILIAGVALSSFGLVLLGISAIVDRLNTLIRLTKEKQ